ncbi:MAG: Aspartyl-tRNA synthetase [Candidatus Uhrbacteria bacterium GW2011_GWF2_41_16]|uniref:Aspartyl-tRNA synthetase n=2 Tax=Candidatus Uhriibacteriota TaxID=1752732 RepID=A0A0G0VC73_9BACT|nr:MAG: Aspartyl-tRNA synthetase [Candidatus Uhrbacteria bacterium GW2011_GWA2_41_10]KKR87544.1 MAG: Aspartyl-tRNA synthetase [Candidatus Uhrbacteria bacterium GW2011_GWC2_41_11]KKR98524.1 MAG: Aspartyl-tRNA synthetase [Candidatus Uhrbacteria bacterium GW2011_GWF2_41_16]HBO99939.1 aspartate--tRNA ligase [Candidatus Uhrbacteria bacterium]
MQRTWNIDTVQKVGETVKLNGWVHHIRRMGDKLVFIDLRDSTGLVQVVCYKPDLDAEAVIVLDEVGSEYVLELEGVVQKRGEKQVNPDLATGTIEVGVKKLVILNRCKTPPFEIDKDTSGINEELRLKYRYLDLRSERLQKNLRLRNQFVQACRNFLLKQKFVEIETPYLTKATPEGSRDFVVPARLQPGKFFALPQSPQQYKQLLMVAGFERYFQLARAFRDEDPRADRGFEHTQVDIEMSFVERDDVMAMVEAMVIETVESLGFTIKQKPFPRITYAESIAKYGADKFDMRTEEDKKNNILAYAWVVDFPFFEKTEEGGWTFTHNPFSMPKPEFLADHLTGKNIEQILTTQYDLVCNGYESGGGSIRAHDSEILKATYRIMGYSEQEIQDSVGHMLEAFGYGAPPHGGIALGVERNLMNLTGEVFLREVQSFPMTGSAHTSVMDAPSELPEKSLREVHITKLNV